MPQISTKKKIVFAVITLAVIFLLTEISIRVVFFQFKTKSNHKLAVTLAVSKALHAVQKKIAEKAVKSIPRRLNRYIDSPLGREMTTYFKQQCSEYIRLFMQEAELTGAKVIVLYIPAIDDEEIIDNSLMYFKAEAEKYNALFVDVTEDLNAYPADVVTFQPVDGHFSRFGNRLIALRVKQIIQEEFDGVRSSVKFNQRPELLGDLKPNQDAVWEVKRHMPYSLVSNAQGTRNESDITLVNPEKQRVLVLGASVTFGPYLPNHDTFSAQLERLMPETEVINASFGGYIISDKYTLLRDRAKFSNSDIIILQVGPGDISNFYYYKRNEFDRERKVWVPSEPEKKFFEYVEKQEALQ